MAERKMSLKSFLKKASGKVSAQAFLSAHREWLTTGEVAHLTSPILRKLDDKVLLPTPCLEEIKGAVFGHMMNQESARAEKSIAQGNQPKIPKDWVATIHNANGGEVETKDFEKSSEADGWTDRKLFEGCSDWYGVIQHSTLKVATVIMRQDAIARTLKTSKGPVCQRKGVSTKALGFGVKAKQDRAHFSHG